ncbi:hypothetical protein MKY88_24240 [Lysinibacillus sp. FSL R7-0073]|uniref:hypothetical protein n=1 Tax=Lysinibacillus sp. FSL R7-0073 TaxID=2921669 RepID=UPI0030F675DD
MNTKEEVLSALETNDKSGIIPAINEIFRKNVAMVDKHYETKSYQIEGEDTIVYRIKRDETDGVPYTVLEVASPINSNNGYSSNDTEATLTLMREIDGDSGGAEFVDFFNNGYEDSRKMGVRIQSRGAGALRDFVFEFNDGNFIKEVFKIATNYVELQNDLKIKKDGRKIISFLDGNGALEYQVGKVSDRFMVSNANNDASIEIFDNGYIKVYTPTSVGLYTDDMVYINDLPISTINSGSIRPANPIIGQQFFDTTISKIISWNGSTWLDNSEVVEPWKEASLAEGVTGSLKYRKVGGHRVDMCFEKYTMTHDMGDDALPLLPEEYRPGYTVYIWGDKNSDISVLAKLSADGRVVMANGPFSYTGIVTFALK